MQTENRNTRQVAGDRRRRWFTDESLDLVVWYEPDGAIFGFQICHDPHGLPRVLTWTPTHGFAHAALDDGEEGYANRAPMLRPDVPVDAAPLCRACLAAADVLPPAEKDFVATRLSRYLAFAKAI